MAQAAGCYRNMLDVLEFPCLALLRMLLQEACTELMRMSLAVSLVLLACISTLQAVKVDSDDDDGITQAQDGPGPQASAAV